MSIAKVKHFLDHHQIDYNVEDVRLGKLGPKLHTAFWPYKMAAILVFGEVPGIRKLPGHLILAPVPVLCRLCPDKIENVKKHIEAAVAIGLFDAVEYYSGHALITVPATAWELGVLDIDGKFAGLEAPLVRSPLVSPPAPPLAPKPKKVGRPRSWVHVSELPEEYR